MAKTAAQLDAEIESWLREQRARYARERKEREKRRYGGHRPFGPKDV